MSDSRVPSEDHLSYGVYFEYIIYIYISKLQVWLIKREVIPSFELLHFSTAEGKDHSYLKPHRYEKYFGITFMLAIYLEKLWIKVYLSSCSAWVS